MPGTPHDSLETWHLAPEVAEAVRDWFSGRIPEFTYDGVRSIRIAHPSDPERRIKIKGAGLKAGPIQFGKLRATGPTMPRFDFEGRMMVDVASGHDGAVQGGASFQQAVTEWRVSARLSEIGYSVVPCLGYGKIVRGGMASWFSVFDLQDAWYSAAPPNVTIQRYNFLKHHVARSIVDFATDHRLVGFLWCLEDGSGTPRLKDLHPFFHLDPVNASSVTWVMHLFFAMHIYNNATTMNATQGEGAVTREEAILWTPRPLLPDIRIEEYEALRSELVRPYMLKPKEDFRVEDLVRLLASHRLTAAMLERCPPEFARY